ncbi:sulfate-binding protein Sbp [Bacillus sp. JCM 19046]|uniref:Sulfate transport system substrate-binding protein n=1 Tax=Shouchella xiaoxiensis TaxID=766895 RepID=A0ABS2SVJ3_9BACI|nr:sulfate ABC transporter substrate-binding protein [Shouchella xiaoxiensis]MBM7838830.1 sulfate transport system substrate-binding protein [Shouchella xiaoxiensis]GAF19946.1 sulfate-binding protein Sbp [Bacillus sp. JCM 19046]
MKKLALPLTLSIFALVSCQSESSSGDGGVIELLNVSYDPTRELYADVDDAFIDYWQEQTGDTVKISVSHGGSGSQARSVLDGLEADVVTLALAYDIDVLQERELLDADWQSQFPEQSAPYTSTINFLVRKGNPKDIQDWDDLIREDVEVVTPNPKTSGGARWNYLAAWGYAEETFGSEDEAQTFVHDIYQNVAVLDSGARGATTSFVERGIGDVLLAWENEAILAANELGEDEFDIVTPSMSILTEPPVAIVDKVVDRKGTREVAEGYLEFLYTEEAQRLIADHHYRPRDQDILAEYSDTFPEVELFTINEKFGSWQEAQEKHFSDGGIFDAIYQP